MGKGCDKLMEGCMIFGGWADYYIENGIGRAITRKKRGRSSSKRKSRAGPLFFKPEGRQDVYLQLLRMLLWPAASRKQIQHSGAMTKSNYYSKVDDNTCTGCETCLDRCQVNAIKVEDGPQGLTRPGASAAVMCLHLPG